jgi:DNA-binding MarR family transcriptional regulator
MAASALKTDDAPAPGTAPLAGYVSLLHALERAQRQLHETVGAELQRAGVEEVTAVQALLIFHLGDAELSAAEIMHSGRYLGSNVSYNLKKLTESGWMNARRDEGAPRFSVTDAGRSVQAKLWALFERQRDALQPVCALDADAVLAAETALKKLERYWLDQVRYRL